MSELGAPWGEQSASDRVWPGGRPPTGSPASAPPASAAKTKKNKKKAVASKGLAAKHAAQEKQAAGKKEAVEHAAAEREVAPPSAAAVGTSSPAPEPEPDPLDSMKPQQIFDELVGRGLLDPAKKNTWPSEEEQREMLRSRYSDEAGRAYAVRLAEVDLPARAYAESRNRLISRMVFQKAASEALKHGQNEAEIALTRPSAPPVYEEWAAGDDPEPSRLDTMARWCVPVRTRRRTTGAPCMRAMTPSDVKARKQRVAAEAAKAMRLASGRRTNNQTSTPSVSSQPGPRQRRAAAAAHSKNASASRPLRRSTKTTRSPALTPTPG